MEEKESDVEKGSDTESELDFDPETYEKSREEHLRKIIIAEAYYHKIRVLLRERRTAEIKTAKTQLQDGTHPELEAGIKEIEDASQMAKWSSDVMYILQKESRDRKLAGQKYTMDMEQIESKRMLKEKMERCLEARIAEKILMQRNYKIGMRLLSSISKQLATQPIVTEDDVRTMNCVRKTAPIVMQADEFELEQTEALAKSMIFTKEDTSRQGSVSSSDTASSLSSMST